MTFSNPNLTFGFFEISFSWHDSGKFNQNAENKEFDNERKEKGFASTTKIM